MSTKLMHPPATGGSTTVNGRKYASPAGTPINVPDFDAVMLEANGWFQVADTGTTAQRPVNPQTNFKYYDSTVGGPIFWDGKTWRHQGTGASV
jgi:hypothetical protein